MEDNRFLDKNGVELLYKDLRDRLKNSILKNIKDGNKAGSITGFNNPVNIGMNAIALGSVIGGASCNQIGVAFKNLQEAEKEGVKLPLGYIPTKYFPYILGLAETDPLVKNNKEKPLDRKTWDLLLVKFYLSITSIAYMEEPPRQDPYSSYDELVTAAKNIIARKQSQLEAPEITPEQAENLRQEIEGINSLLIIIEKNDLSILPPDAQFEIVSTCDVNLDLWLNFNDEISWINGAAEATGKNAVAIGPYSSASGKAAVAISGDLYTIPPKSSSRPLDVPYKENFEEPLNIDGTSYSLKTIGTIDTTNVPALAKFKEKFPDLANYEGQPYLFRHAQKQAGGGSEGDTLYRYQRGRFKEGIYEIGGWKVKLQDIYSWGSGQDEYMPTIPLSKKVRVKFIKVYHIESYSDYELLITDKDFISEVKANGEIDLNTNPEIRLVLAEYVEVDQNEKKYKETIAQGNSSIARGTVAVATGAYSSAEGYKVTANSTGQRVFGRLNEVEPEDTTVEPNNTKVEIVGWGMEDEKYNPETHTYESLDVPRNIRTLDRLGNEVLTGTITAANFLNSDGEILSTQTYVDDSIKDAVNSIPKINLKKSLGNNSIVMVGDSTTPGYSNDNNASGDNAFAVGWDNSVSGENAAAFGALNNASGDDSVASGRNTTSSGIWSHAEGNGTTASGKAAHAEGNGTTASKNNAHAEGRSTAANGTNAHAEGDNTIAGAKNQHVFGAFNIEDNTDTVDTKVEIVGYGTSDTDRKNIRTLDRQGNMELAGSVKATNYLRADGTQLIETLTADDIILLIKAEDDSRVTSIEQMLIDINGEEVK